MPLMAKAVAVLPETVQISGVPDPAPPLPRLTSAESSFGGVVVQDDGVPVTAALQVPGMPDSRQADVVKVALVQPDPVDTYSFPASRLPTVSLSAKRAMSLGSPLG